jgi:UDP-N-acetylglucosamine 2-epimerase (non-hydrolysing)
LFESQGSLVKNTKRRVLFVFGTRPEAIKLAPVVRALSMDGKFDPCICVTGQHRAMLDQVLHFFGLVPDFDLDLMTSNQTLSSLTARVLQGVSDVLASTKPCLVVVQGDTTTTFAGALAAFLHHIPIAHVEAGLRSHRFDSPFPEEANRVLTSRLSALHFAPTPTAAANLGREGIVKGVQVVGNTVVDALLHGLEIITRGGDGPYKARFAGIDFDREIVLATIHRRESHGEPLLKICRALQRLSIAEPESQIVYPVHLNPNIKGPVTLHLAELPNVHLIEPLAYDDFIWLMSKSSLIITDSGGVQEEAPSLGLPVLVVREVTERMEGVEGGAATLLGFDEERIVSAAREELAKRRIPGAARSNENPYGDGLASQRIARTLGEFLL